MSFMKEFKDFAVRGNVVDMAVGIIIGAAFGKIVASMVKDVIMPPVGLLTGGLDFTKMGLVLGADAEKYDSVIKAREAGAPILEYGTFLSAALDFVIIALVIFIMIRQMNKLKKAAPPPPPPNTHDCPKCLNAIPLKATRCGFCTSEVAPA